MMATSAFNELIQRDVLIVGGEGGWNFNKHGMTVGLVFENSLSKSSIIHFKGIRCSHVFTKKSSTTETDVSA